MTTGNTGEKVLISGTYFCNDFPDNESFFVKDDTFPRNVQNEKETTWTLKEIRAENKETKDPGIGQQAKQTKEKSSDQKEEKPNQNEKESKNENNGPKTRWFNLEVIYKKKGFFAALNKEKNTTESSYKLEQIIALEDNKIKDRIEELEKNLHEQKDFLKTKYDDLGKDVDDKIKIKQEYEAELKLIQEEFNKTNDEIKKNYEDLREEIKNLGASKEGLIKKRIDEFESEINKLIEIYQNVENSNNQKFRKDFDAKNLRLEDKQFYYNYRKKLEEAFNNVEVRLRALEKEGLNITVSRFLITMGWLSAFTTSWYFNLWYNDSDNNNSNIIVHICDGIRLFTQKMGWPISLLTFLGYIIVILYISKYCYEVALKRKFIKGESDEKEANEDNIEFKFNKESIIKTHFRASNWYEMWLKIAPLLSIIFLLIVLLAIGTEAKNPGIYADMSNSNYLQLIGIVLPIATMPLFYLYITRVIEKRNFNSPDNQTADSLIKNNKLSWEIILIMILFILHVLLLLQAKIQSPLLNERQMGISGFLIGCITTGFALSFGYRYISLKESYSTLLYANVEINEYIEFHFYPYEVSFLKNVSISQRMHHLFHSLLGMSESKNNLGVYMLNPHLKTLPDTKQNTDTANQKVEKKEYESKSVSPTEDQDNPIKRVFNNVVRYFKDKEQKYLGKLKWKSKQIKDLKEKVKEAKKDNVDIEELTYFPEIGVKIKQYKSLIEKLEKHLLALKEELDSKYRNEKNYASINQQIENIKTKISNLKADETNLENKFIEERNDLEKESETYKRWIEEGFNLGEWFAKNNGKMI